MAKTFRATLGLRLGNAAVTALLRAGVRLGGMRLLTVRGRKSGLPRTTPVTIGERDGRQYVIAPYGEVQWVRNVRAAGKAVLRRGRHAEAVRMVELPAADAAPVLKEILGRAPRFLRQYFDATPEAPLADFLREARRHPVFLVEPQPSTKL